MPNKLPALRPVDVIQTVNDEGEPCFVLHDMMQLTSQSLVLSVVGYITVAHLDGEHSIADIQAVYRDQYEVEVEAEQIENLVAALDQAYLLEGERFEQALGERRARYQAAPTRDNRSRYPDADTLRRMIDEIIASGTAAPVSEVRGLIAPHLDYPRGAPCYADAYATLRHVAPADRYVILGTNHAGRSAAVVATRKDFETPLGVAPVDAAFVDRLEARLGVDLCVAEDDHDIEHSVELQVHMLQVVQPERPFRIVPVLCPSPCGPTGLTPADGTGPDLDALADALSEELTADAERTVLIAGADLSHVGQRFGDPEVTTPEFLKDVEEVDRGLLRQLEKGATDDFVGRLAETDNPTRVCSAGCLYALMRALPGGTCRVMRYHQAVDMEQETHVTCAAGVVS